MILTNKLFLRHFYHFILIHTSDVQCFWATDTLQNRHRIATDSTFITVMQRASEVQWVWVDKFEMVFARIVLYAFGMEIFGTVCSWTLSHFILSFVLWSKFSLLFAWFALRFFWFLVLHTIIATFLFASEASHKVIFAIIASEANFHCLFKGLFIQAELRYF